MSNMEYIKAHDFLLNNYKTTIFYSKATLLSINWIEQGRLPKRKQRR